MARMKREMSTTPMMFSKIEIRIVQPFSGMRSVNVLPSQMLE
jgi:hypothetical protein